ncbi:MAG TPA: diacylglycerol kinase family protein [Solirubrobacteraceae bacterium]|jgi:YegS/Rv2252/BmrU family lipid kinase|nr:diacylglycerol kinase family protein [Solirubrobacteraceae bacterium]
MLSLIVNPSAGGGRAGRALDSVCAELAAHGLDHHVETTNGLEHAAELARAAVVAGELAVAFGGDGLIGAVAGALAGTDGVLGVLPGGRGNDFARGLGIPLKPVAACAILSNGALSELDLGTAGERTFIGIASCGFDSDVNRIANESRIIRGNLVYSYATVRALFSWRRASFTVTLDGGEPRRFTGYSVAVANTAYFGGGMRLAPQALVDDGLLEVVTITDLSRLRFLRLLPTVFSGSHVKQAVVGVARASRVEIAADRPFTLYADGEAIAELPVTVSVLPRAVKVMVPG